MPAADREKIKAAILQAKTLEEVEMLQQQLQAGNLISKVANFISLKMAERSEATSVNRSFASKNLIFWVFKRSFASLELKAYEA